MNKNQIKGAVREVKGEIKDLAGRVTNNAKMRASGKLDKAAGRIQRLYRHYTRVQITHRIARVEDRLAGGQSSAMVRAGTALGGSGSWAAWW